MKAFIKNTASHFLPVLFFLPILIMIIFVLQQDELYMQNDEPAISAVDKVEISCNGTSASASLPLTLHNLKPRTEVHIKFLIAAGSDTLLLVKSVYSPFKIFVNNELSYAYGQDGSFPSFMKDPPTMLRSVHIPESAVPSTVEMVCLSPSTRDFLSLAAPVMGSDRAIGQYILKSMGPTFILSLITLTFGFTLLIISISLLLIEFRWKSGKNSSESFWLSAFALTGGLWGITESNFTIMFFGHAPLLFLLSFMSLYALPIPLIYFTRQLIYPRHYIILDITVVFSEFLLLAAVVLELTGILPFQKSMYLFHLEIPSVLFLSILCLCYDIRKYHNPRALYFLIPFILFLTSAILEIMNYNIHFSLRITNFTLIGGITFVLFSAIFVSLSARELHMVKEKEQEISFELKMQEKQTEIHKERARLLLEHMDSVRRQRHDLRHQLAILQSFADSGLYDRLNSYLNGLIQSVPAEPAEHLSSNAIINAIAGYYYALAKTKQIRTDLLLNVPAVTPSVSDQDLCIIFGNLMENAVEACEYLPAEKRFIALHTRIQGELLFLTLDNSFDGTVRLQDGKYISRKRNVPGTGLESVRSVVSKHDGTADFSSDAAQFHCELYFRY